MRSNVLKWRGKAVRNVYDTAAEELCTGALDWVVIGILYLPGRSSGEPRIQSRCEGIREGCESCK